MADTKLSALTELDATPATGDELYIRDVSEATADESKRITVENLVAAAAAGAVTREGGNTTEATSTATSAADMLTSSTLSVAAAEEMQYIVNGRKTAGGVVENAALGIKINSTVTGEALSQTPSRTWGSSTADVAQSGGGQGWFGSRVTNYQACSGGDSNAYGVSGGSRASGTLGGLCETAVVPIATITVVVIRGITDNSANTVAADELHVYKFATS